jgi:uncharacterized protein (TIGR02246 family)
MKTASLLGLCRICDLFRVARLYAEHPDSKIIVHQRDLLGVAKASDDFGAVSLKLEEAFKKNDASAIAALFTEDGILVASNGMCSGRQAIEKRYADIFQRWPITTLSGQRYQLNVIDNAVWSESDGFYSKRDRSQIRRRLLVSDLYSRGDDWKIRLLTFSGRPQPSRD